MNLTQATPKKLRNGSWGAMVTDSTGLLVAGAPIQITTRSGKSWVTHVGRILWKGDGKAIVTTYHPRQGHYRSSGSECHTDGNCSSMCSPRGDCPCADGSWFSCC